MHYDIIGDIHGHADKLEALLRKLGYRSTGGAWRQPGHQVVFVGDFIDRGPAQLRTIRTARGMIDAGSALTVTGNHAVRRKSCGRKWNETPAFDAARTS